MSTIRDCARTPRILLIEDNSGDAMLMQIAFKRSGIIIDVEVVGTAESGLRFLRREGEFANAQTPDLVLVDLNLPFMSGHQFVKLVKEDPALRRLPVVVLSSSCANEDIGACYDCHANGYIAKPASVDGYADLVEMLDHYWFSMMQHPSTQGSLRSISNGTR